MLERAISILNSKDARWEFSFTSAKDLGGGPSHPFIFKRTTYVDFIETNNILSKDLPHFHKSEIHPCHSGLLGTGVNNDDCSLLSLETEDVIDRLCSLRSVMKEKCILLAVSQIDHISTSETYVDVEVVNGNVLGECGSLDDVRFQFPYQVPEREEEFLKKLRDVKQTPPRGPFSKVGIALLPI